MIEVVGFRNPFDTHELCIKPYLDAVTGLGSLRDTIRKFRAFDREQVAPRVRPEKQRLHRFATHPLILWTLGIHQVGAKRLGKEEATYDQVVAFHTTLKRATRRLPRGMGELVHAFDHEGSCEGVWGQDYEQETYKGPDGEWRLGIRHDTIKGPFSSCE